MPFYIGSTRLSSLIVENSSDTTYIEVISDLNGDVTLGRVDEVVIDDKNGILITGNKYFQDSVDEQNGVMTTSSISPALSDVDGSIVIGK